MTTLTDFRKPPSVIFAVVPEEIGFTVTARKGPLTITNCIRKHPGPPGLVWEIKRKTVSDVVATKKHPPLMDQICFLGISSIIRRRVSMHNSIKALSAN